MKTPTEIHAELCSAHDHATPECCCERCKNGHACFLLVSDITKIIEDAKVEGKGVCEWRLGVRPFAYTTACKTYYPTKEGKFCPGCGKEVKVA